MKSQKMHLSICFLAILSCVSNRVDCAIDSCGTPGRRQDMFYKYDGVQLSPDLPEEYVQKTKASSRLVCYSLCSLQCTCSMIGYQYPECHLFDEAAMSYVESSSEKKLDLYTKNV